MSIIVDRDGRPVSLALASPTPVMWMLSQKEFPLRDLKPSHNSLALPEAKILREVHNPNI